MAFDNKKFAPIGGNASKAMAMYGYRTTDPSIDVEGADYFIELKFRLTPGDTIVVTNLQGNTLYRVLADRYSIEKIVLVDSFGAVITDDAGDGTVEGDLNATDFTGHAHAVGSALAIKSQDIVTFAHKIVAYQWVGPKDVTVGVGGSYVAVADDFIGIGTADHAILTNLTVGDPHTQYPLTANAIVTWTLAGYGGIRVDTREAYSLEGTWRDVDAFDIGSLVDPRFILQDAVNSGLRFERQGVWKTDLYLELSHDESNSSRQLSLRIWNDTKGIEGVSELNYYTARNQAGTVIVANFLTDIIPGNVDDLYKIQLRTDDTYSSVWVENGTFQTTHVSEAISIEVA